MSLYGKFIEEVLEKEYNLIKLFKSDDMSDIRLFRHNETQNNLVRIHSKNRNDHVYRNLRGMRHSNLPVIYDACSCEEHLCVLESYVEGVPLSELMNKSTITPENTINYVMDVCTALAFLHKNKIIHRDGGDAHTLGGVGETLAVAVGAEQLDLVIGAAISLQTFKDFLTIVEHGAGGIQREGTVGDDAGIVPALALGIVHQEHIVRGDLGKLQFGLISGFFLVGSDFFDSDIQHIVYSPWC